MARVYQPSGNTTLAFHRSDKFVRCIRGPIGSGKTVACCYELFQMALAQQPSPLDGWKRTRWAVTRNTYRMLETSTIKTWLAQFPEHIFGRFKWSPPYKHLIVDENAKFQMEVIFLALDDDDNIRDLLSTEWTGAFANEAREIPKSLVDAIYSRLRRYPAMADGGPTRPGFIMDTNAPPADHWWGVMAGDVAPPEWMSEVDRRLLVRPDDWEFFAQPPALIERIEGGELTGYEVNPMAENIKNLHPEYYSTQWKGKDKDWIDVYLMNRYKELKAGKPVYPMFNQDVHVFKKIQEINPKCELIMGVDFGLSPSAVLLQRFPSGRYQGVMELVGTDMTIPAFGALLAKELAQLGVEPTMYRGWGDPAGDARDQSGETAFQLMRNQGVYLTPAPTNDPSIRIGTVAEVLNRLDGGTPMIRFNPTMRMIIQGFLHGYRYRKKKVKGDYFEDKPDKNQYSHPHDALQYALLGAGEGRKLMAARSAKIVQAPRVASVWGQHGLGGRSRRAWN